MIKDSNRVALEKVVEIERMILTFKEKLENKTNDSESFITMNEIEQAWSELRGNTDNLYSDMVRQLMSSIDESSIIRKKKGNTETKE